MDETWQQTVDWLAREIRYGECDCGTSRLHLDWGNYYIECSDYPPLKEALVKLAKDYLRLRDLESKGQLGIMRESNEGLATVQ